MKGKLAIVTGPTSGIGREIATQLAARGAEVVLACRDVAKGQATLEEIARRTGAKAVSVMHVDVEVAGVCGRDVDDARGRAGLEDLQELVREQMVAEYVGREGELDAIGALAPCA